MQAADLLERIRRCAMPRGIPEPKGTWIRQEGEMRFAPDRPWLPFTAQQWFWRSGIDFLWQAHVRMGPLVRVRVIDSFEGGRGKLRASFLGFIPIVRSEGPTTDVGEAMRGLAELPWRPSGFRDAPPLSWEPAGPDKLRAVFDDGRTRASVEFRIDAEGHVLGAASNRPRIAGKSVVETPWSGTFGDYQTFDGLRVPAAAEVSWHPAEGPFAYWRGRVTDFRVLK